MDRLFVNILVIAGAVIVVRETLADHASEIRTFIAVTPPWVLIGAAVFVGTVVMWLFMAWAFHGTPIDREVRRKIHGATRE